MLEGSCETVDFTLAESVAVVAEQLIVDSTVLGLSVTLVERLETGVARRVFVVGLVTLGERRNTLSWYCPDLGCWLQYNQ